MEQIVEVAESIRIKILMKVKQADQKTQRLGCNRRAKRAHLRGVSRPAPNKHSQLFISLLDSGRPAPF